jgi:diacylglycerol kinase family enzyme
VHHQQAKLVTVESLEDKVGLDLDGEYASGEKLRFSVKSGALQMLVGG